MYIRIEKSYRGSKGPHVPVNEISWRQNFAAIPTTNRCFALRHKTPVSLNEHQSSWSYLRSQHDSKKRTKKYPLGCWVNQTERSSWVFLEAFCFCLNLGWHTTRPTAMGNQARKRLVAKWKKPWFFSLLLTSRKFNVCCVPLLLHARCLFNSYYYHNKNLWRIRLCI